MSLHNQDYTIVTSLIGTEDDCVIYRSILTTNGDKYFNPVIVTGIGGTQALATTDAIVEFEKICGKVDELSI